MNTPSNKNQSPQKDMNIQNLSVREEDTEDNLRKEIKIIQENINYRYPLDEFWFGEGFNKGFLAGQKSKEKEFDKLEKENLKDIEAQIEVYVEQAKAETMKKVLEEIRILKTKKIGHTIPNVFVRGLVFKELEKRLNKKLKDLEMK